jgi:hypothetical protein
MTLDLDPLPVWPDLVVDGTFTLRRVMQHPVPRARCVPTPAGKAAAGSREIPDLRPLTRTPAMGGHRN